MLNIFKYYKERLKSLLYYFIIFNFFVRVAGPRLSWTEENEMCNFGPRQDWYRSFGINFCIWMN